MKLLCLSEDESLGKQVCSAADEMQWTALWVHDRGNMPGLLNEFDPDLVLVDVAQAAGLEWWKQAGGSVGQCATLLLDWELKEDFLTRALEAGADGYLQKPFSNPLLVAKVKAVLRRQAPSAARRHYPDLGVMIDNERYTVEAHGRPVALTMTEFKILRELAANEGQVVPRAGLQNKVFGPSEVSNRSLDVHICSLRKKFKSLGVEIGSVRGVGYRVSPCRI